MRWDDRYHGLLLMHKPIGWSSHDLVAKVRGITGQRSIGHTGTLDPLADGLLILCLGKATRLAQFMEALDKTYVAKVRLGITSSTFDAEGISPDTAPNEIPALDRESLEGVLGQFVGELRQQVPAFSAVQVNGRRLYEMARRGERIDVPTRSINISRIELVEYTEPDLTIEVSCSKGTYIRALAHDIGQALGCGAYLAGLTRTRIGGYTLDNALTWEELDRLSDAEAIHQLLVPLADVLAFSSIHVTDQFCAMVSHGRSPASNDVQTVSGSFRPGDRVTIKNAQGELLAVGTARVSSDDMDRLSPQPLIDYVRVLA